MKPDTCVVTEEPEVEPVSLSEAKQQLGIMEDFEEWDAFLLEKISVGRELVESRLGRSLAVKKFRAKWKAPGRKLTLPNPPLVLDEEHPLTVTADGDAVAESQYEVEADARPAYLEFDVAPAAPAVVEWWAGGSVSKRIKAAILLYVVHLFENRGVLAANSSVELPQAFEALLASDSHNGGW
jgi:uncharacterized phiE125 gp8 family phage protein